MDFYYIQENGGWVLLQGSVKKIYQAALKLCEKEDQNSGFLGAIDDSGKLRGTTAFHVYRLNSGRNALFDFIRKYQAIQVLEKLASNLKEQANGN